MFFVIVCLPILNLVQNETQKKKAIFDRRY